MPPRHPRALPALERCVLTATLSAADRDALLASALVRRFERGADLFVENQPPVGLFVLLSGAVKIYKLGSAGREVILHLHETEGDPLAELPLLDGEPYPASGAALSDSEVLFVPRAAFDAFLATRPEACRALVAALAGRLRRLVSLVEDLSLRQVRGRLARFLLAESRGRDAFVLTNTNDELASRLGSVRDVLSRTLGGLQADRLIRLTGRHVLLLDRPALEAEAE